MKNISLISIVLFLLTGCFAAKDSVQIDTKPSTETLELPTANEGNNPPPILPKFINHPRPNLQVDLTNFLKTSGCKLKGSSEIEGCEGLRAKMGCDKFMQPEALWGAVTPAYPMVLCIVLPDARQYPKSEADAKALVLELIKDIEKEGYFTRSKGMFRHYTRYVILRDGQFQLVKNIDELQKIFAPIESTKEALSYALMATQFVAHYGQKIVPNYRYYTTTIEDTNVVVTEKGYDVLLYTYKKFGCGSHPTSTNLITVGVDGMISYPSQQLAYANPNEDNLCVD